MLELPPITPPTLRQEIGEYLAARGIRWWHIAIAIPLGLGALLGVVMLVVALSNWKLEKR